MEKSILEAFTVSNRKYNLIGSLKACLTIQAYMSYLLSL
jgi:hypothetical protein